MIEQHLKDWLLADPLIAAEVGTRIFPQFVPENEASPALAYSMVSDQATLTLAGPAKIRDPRIQLSIVAKGQPKVSYLAELIKARIAIWDAVYPDMAVSSCFAEGGVYLSLDYYTPPRNGMIIEAFLNWVPV